MKYPSATLQSIVSISGGGTPSKTRPDFFTGTIPWVTPKDMKTWDIIDSRDHITEEAVKSSTARMIDPGAVLVVIRSGVLKHTLPVGINRVPVTVNQDLKVLRCNGTVNAEYLARALKFATPQLLMTTRGSTADSISTDVLKNLKIPLPPLSEQKRIAGILDKADAIRRKRQDGNKLTKKFLRSTFLEMFGDPVTNPKGLRQCSLGDSAEFVSGGTPAKSNAEYWDGEFPWVSPKDMKTVQIDDAIDHVSELAFDETTLKRIPEHSILFVIRGMILVHTVPVSINTCPVAINQDMKALLPVKDILPDFLLWSLRCQHNHILTKVATAAHGTKRLEVETLKALMIPKVSKSEQERFVRACRLHEKSCKNMERSLADSDNLFNSLTQRAFRGEL